jgi:hypothetical protein
MFTGAEIDDTGILLLTAAEPFSVDEVLAFTSDVAAGRHPGIALDMPSILDIRRVDLVRIPTSEVSRYVMRRRALTEQPQAGDMAIVCGDMGSFGMLRMFGVVSELAGLRMEERLLVTMEFDEAVDFIRARTGRPPETRDALLAAIMARADAQASRA